MGKREEFAAEFREIQPKFSRLYAGLLEKVNLTLPQYVLLNQLERSGTISMTEASRRLRITKPAITHLVDRLEEKKLLKRLPHSKDRRVMLLEIQPKGEKIVSGIQGYSLEMLLSAYDQFDGSEREIISRFYSVISRVLDSRLTESSK